MRRKPAPGNLALIESYCNTAVHLHGWDALSSIARAGAWLTSHGFARPRSASELSALCRYRETVRGFLVDRTAPEAVAALNALIAEVSGPVEVAADGSIGLSPRSRAEVDAVARAVLSALLQYGLIDRGARLKACAAPECRWVFYDRAPAGNGLWCDMDVCGARHKMRALRSRKPRG